MTRDVAILAARLKAAATARAHFDQAVAALLDELGVSSWEDENRVTAMVSELADPSADVTEADARELLRRTDR